MNDNSVPQRVPEVSSQLESLENVIIALEHSIGDLSTRIEPIVANVPEIKAKVSEIRKACSCTLANSILTKTEKLDLLLEQVRNIISRVEV